MEIGNEINSLTDVSQHKRCSGFGVILDSTRSNKTKNNPEHYTQIKIIDHSYNPTLDLQDVQKKYITLFIYWNQNEHNPFVHKIGDVIRFCSFDFENFRGQIQGKNKKGASWKIHHGDSNVNDPYCHSLEAKEKTTQSHITRLNELRDWAISFFSSYSLVDLDWYSYERLANNTGSIQSFDLLLKIEDIRFSSDPANEFFQLNLVNEKLKKYKLKVAMINRGILQIGDIVKVRSIEKIEGEILAPFDKYHAILILPDYCIDIRNFNETLKEYENSLKLQKDDADKKVIHINHHVGFDIEFFNNKGVALEEGRTVCSTIAEKWKESNEKIQISKIFEDLDSSQELNENEKRYYIRASLVDIQPRNLKEALRNQCKICKLLRKIDANEGEICCSTRMDRIFLLRMIWIDDSIDIAAKYLITYSYPEEGDSNRIIFPDFDLNKIKISDVEKLQNSWEELIEKQLEDDRVYDILVKPFDNQNLKEKTSVVPLRLFDTMFLPVLEA